MLPTTLAQSARLGVRALSARRSYVTAQTAVGGASSQPLHSAPGAPIPAKTLDSLGSIEASWVSLPRPEQERIYSELQELQKKDWKELSLDEKKASYYISYGPHGPRSPIVPANSGGKVILGSIACFGLAAGLFALARYNSHETPKTMNKEWKEAQDEYAKSQKMDPFTGASRTDGKGKSFAT